jgi:hypothetical protein
MVRFGATPFQSTIAFDQGPLRTYSALNMNDAIVRPGSSAALAAPSWTR